ncbi:MAG: helix-turn-helix domain-containing protein [Williamsia sp.]|nr:helix-turn-helix domain-containing protein [Williamsia sp.]
MFSKACRLFFALILLCSALVAQTGINAGLRMHALSVNEGLPQGAVAGIAQDSRGFIWILSDGLSRYDGRNFVHFRHIAGDTSSLTSNYADYMRMDDKDNLWIIHASREVDVFNTLTGRVRHISTEKAFKWLNSAAVDVYFIAQEGGRYFRANLTSLVAFDPWGTYKDEIPLPPGENLLAIGTTRRSRQVVSTDKALYEIRGNRLFKLIDFPAPSKENREVLQQAVYFHGRTPGRILENPDGALIIPVVGAIYLYNQINHSLNSLPIGTGRMAWGIVQAGGYAYARASEGLIRFDEQGQVNRLVKEADLHLTDLLLVDQSGVLWTTTANATGLRLFDLQPLNFQSYHYSNGFLHDVLEPWMHNPLAPEQVAWGSYMGRCAKDSNGNYWSVANLYTLGTGKGTKRVEKRTVNTAWSGPGVYRLAGNSASKRPFNLPGWRVTNMAFDSRNQCWLTITSLDSAENKLVKADIQTGQITPFAQLPDMLTENWYLTCTGRKICVVTENKLRLYDSATGACAVLSKEQVGSGSMLLMGLPDLHDRRILWLATKGSGIIRLNIETYQTVRYTEANGLPNNTVYYMARDKQGFFWCSSNKGLFRFDPATGATVSFLAKDGLQGNEFNRYHFVETPDGHFVFGGTEGYSIFHPDSVSTDHFQTPVIISGIQVNNLPLQKVLPRLKDRLLSNLRQLTLAYNQNVLSVGFAGLQYNAPEEIRYRYQLQGLDASWIPAGADASARYAYIPPGHYTFMVNASNTAGMWSNQVKTLDITILPPWWKTGWAYMLYLLVAAGIAWALYRNWLVRARDKQHIILQQKEAEQLKAIDQIKSRFFSNITHEFRTPLSLIIAPVEQMQQATTEPLLKRQLSSVQRNAEQLLQLINQLLDMAKLEAGNMQVSLHRGNLLLFIQDIADGFLFSARTKQLILTCQLPAGNWGEHAFDADKLRKIMQNLLSNAIKFTPAGGSIAIRVELQPLPHGSDGLQICIEDSGIGIAADKLPHIFTRFYQVDDSHTRNYSGTGIGLALVKELTEMMGGTIQAENNKDKTGMLFTLWLPVATATGKETGLPSAGNNIMDRVDQEAPAEPAITHHEPGDTKPLVLVTEDHDELRAFICGVFNGSCRVLEARNGKEGWQLAQQELPDLIISDLMMPEGDGMEFCRKVKTGLDTSHIAFVMLTARSSQASVLEGLQSRADDYIGKPFHADELQLRVRNILDRQQQLRSFYNRQLTVAGEPLQREEKTDLFLQQVYEQVEKHLDDTQFTVEKLAASVAVSTRTLVRKLNAIAAITPADLVKQYRLKRAAELLKEGKPVAEVAWSVGYETRNYFSTAFKAFYGITPSEWGKSAVDK